ncbi:hypothetical protein [Bacillus sp. AFS053548]|uniref:hypothetical protein n=1 Tax=Bacillus sp. AFS053548 TaxID=2033505 RepID=UPI000BFB8515|nr:hypothetical protein [Bacillus sp. AFS053548]PGM49017.1 hypothetical protein CN946_22695 [Bacillus sp. AFS053548]
MNERKLILQQKIKVSKQKKQRNVLINTLPQELATVLENCEIITSPELDRILDKVHAKWNYDLHKGDFIVNYSNFRIEFSWEKEVIQFVQGIDIEEKLAYLFFGIEDSPILLIDDGKWVIKNFDILWQSINNEDIWIISQDYSCGVLVSRYGGYLEHDPNPKEIIYAITKWRDKS